MKLFFILVVALTGFSLAACEKQGPAERVGESIDEAVDDTKDAVDDAAEDTDEALEETGEEIDDAISENN